MINMSNNIIEYMRDPLRLRILQLLSESRNKGYPLEFIAEELDEYQGRVASVLQDMENVNIVSYWDDDTRMFRIRKIEDR